MRYGIQRKPLRTRLYKSQVWRGGRSLWNEARKCRKVAVCSSRHLGIETRGFLRRSARCEGSGLQRVTKAKDGWG